MSSLPCMWDPCGRGWPTPALACDKNLFLSHVHAVFRVLLIQRLPNEPCSRGSSASDEITQNSRYLLLCSYTAVPTPRRRRVHTYLAARFGRTTAPTPCLLEPLCALRGENHGPLIRHARACRGGGGKISPLSDEHGGEGRQASHRRVHNGSNELTSTGFAGDW